MGVRVEKNNLKRKVFALNDFRGVDYASSPMEVKPYRATDMANLLLRDGMLRKRYGFKQVGRLNDYNAKYDIQVFTPFQKGDFLCYVIQFFDKVKGYSYFCVAKEHKDYPGVNNLDFTETVTFENATKLGQAVEVAGALYIFCGTYIKADGDIFKEVTEESAYVPTTTINIPAKYAVYGSVDSEGKYPITSYNVDKSVAYPYESNESINLLTRSHKEALVGYKPVGETEPSAWRYYKLNHKFFWYEKPKIKMTVKHNDTGEEKVFDDFIVEEIGFDIKIPSHVTPDHPELHGYEENHWLTGIPRYVSPSTQIEIGSAMFYKVAPADKSDLYAAIVYVPVNYNGNFKGFPWGDDQYIPISDVTIYIEYEDWGGKDNSSLIGSCNCATTFGVDGANDRIFIGGGENANIVYFSENDINLKPNPTYFPADQFLVCGSSNAPISGFMRVTDGTLAIFKDTTKTADVSVYYASGYYTDAGTGEEGNTYKQARFTVKAGDISRRGISAKAIANLDGDNIFTTAEGVYGIQLSSNVASGERYAKERSRTVNPKISKMGLNHAKGIVFEDKYFLAVDGGEVYVADARYKYTLQGDQQDTFNYEWFRLTGLYVKEWFILDGKLHFIDKDGYICVFSEVFSDQYMVTTENGELTVNDTTATFNEERLELVKKSSYALDDKGRTWQLQLTEDEKAIWIPDDIEIEADSDLTLWFCVPIEAYWQSSVLALENAMLRKNMWSMSMVVNAAEGGRVDLGYKTRFTYKDDIAIQGANGGIFEDINFIGNNFTFDTGGYLGINTYRYRVFERGFTHLQVLFRSDTTNDCAVSEIDVEYSVTIKNIGVG